MQELKSKAQVTLSQMAVGADVEISESEFRKCPVPFSHVVNPFLHYIHLLYLVVILGAKTLVVTRSKSDPLPASVS